MLVAIEQIVAFASLIGGAVLASQLGVPQSVDFESALVFQIVTVVGGVSTLVLVLAGLFCALRSERS